MNKPRFLRRARRRGSNGAERRELRQLQDDAVEAFYGLAKISLNAHEGWEYTLGYAASWTRSIVAGVESVRLLHDEGLGVQAAPVRRLLIEHAVCILAVADDHEAFDSYVRGLQTSTRTMLTGFEKVGLTPSDEMKNILNWSTDESTKRLDTYLHSKHRFEQMGESGERLHVQWLAETQLSHAGFTTAAIYLSDTEGSDFPTLTFDPMVPSSNLIADFICAESLAMALDGLSTILLGDPLRATVEGLNTRRDAVFDSLQQ